MDIVIKSYNGNALNTGNYRTTISPSSPIFGSASGNEIERAGTWGVRGAKQYRGNTMVLEVVIVSGTIAAGIDQLAQWFNEEDSSSYQLIIQDADDSNREWYVDAAALGLVTFAGNMVTVALQIPDPVWKVSTLSTNTWSITASNQTRNLTVIGNRNARPKFTVTPTTARSGGYAYKRFVAVANRTNNLYKSALSLTDGSWDTATLTTAKLQADGDDARVFNDETGVEEYRWFGGGGIDTATTLVWINVALPPKIELTLSGSISSSGAVTSITVKNTTANKTALRALKAVAYKFVAIDMGSGTYEVFKFTSVNESALTITGTTRAQKNTSNQAHSDGATIRHIHGYYLMYGNSSASAPSVDDGYKPIINLATSSNTSFDFDEFYDALYPNRSNQWRPQIIKNVGNESEVYTATQWAFADTATDIGQAISVYTVGTATRAPTADILWSWYHPAGITTLTWSGKKYRYSNTYPASPLMQKSNDGVKWSTIATEAKPTALQTWESLSTHSSVSLSGTYFNIRSRFAGTVAATPGNYAAIEIGDLTATLSSSNSPLIYFAAEENNNYADFRITNNTTGQWLEVSCPLPINTSIVIDTDALTATLSDGTSAVVRLDDESRNEWLPLSPNTTNTLKYTESGAVAVTFLTEWRDRNL